VKVGFLVGKFPWKRVAKAALDRKKAFVVPSWELEGRLLGYGMGDGRGDLEELVPEPSELAEHWECNHD
jgi:hypothetical protein